MNEHEKVEGTIPECLHSILSLLLLREWDNIKLRCFEILVIPFLVNYNITQYEPGVARLPTIHAAQLLHQVHMMSCITCPLSFLCWVHVTSSVSCLVCPLVCPLHYIVALY